MPVFGQVCVPAPQLRPHEALTHAEPAGHAVQSRPSLVPQALEELLPTQTPLQRWKPVSQSCTHCPEALQVTLPLSGAVQTVQLLPHELGFVLVLDTQVRLAPVPHW
jgi:hypothetical protein